MAVAAAGALARWAATTPNAARPNVNNAAKTTTTTRILPSATTATLPTASQSANAGQVNENEAASNQRCGSWFPSQRCADPLVSAAEFVLPTVHGTGQRQRRCRKNATRDGARHHIGGDGTETGQPEL